MPIQFEEVSATVTPPEAQSGGTQSAAPKPAEEDFGTRLEQALRQMAERAARLADD
jgi:hypothetical protein